MPTRGLQHKRMQAWDWLPSAAHHLRPYSGSQSRSRAGAFRWQAIPIQLCILQAIGWSRRFVALHSSLYSIFLDYTLSFVVRPPFLARFKTRY